MDDKNITLYHLSIVLERINSYIVSNYAPSAHVHGTNEITSLAAYTIGEEGNDEMYIMLSPADSLNKAIGKL